jgi:hypothetical protein
MTRTLISRLEEKMCERIRLSRSGRLSHDKIIIKIEQSQQDKSTMHFPGVL